MLSVSTLQPQGLARRELVPPEELPTGTIWVDLFDPSSAEETLVEKALTTLFGSGEIVDERDQLALTAGLTNVG